MILILHVGKLKLSTTIQITKQLLMKIKLFIEEKVLETKKRSTDSSQKNGQEERTFQKKRQT